MNRYKQFRYILEKYNAYYYIAEEEDLLLLAGKSYDRILRQRVKYFPECYSFEENQGEVPFTKVFVKEGKDTKYLLTIKPSLVTKTMQLSRRKRRNIDVEELKREYRDEMDRLIGDTEAGIKVSVIVPVYNCADYLQACLDSLVNQSLEEIEIIVIDDGSTDESGKIIDEYAEKYAYKIEAIHKENSGVGDTRNIGLRQAKGEYIGFVDGDDISDHMQFELMWKTAKAYNRDITACQHIIEYLRTGKKKVVPYRITGNNNSNVFDNPNSALNLRLVCWNKIIRRRYMEENHVCFPKVRKFEDFAFTMALFMGGGTIGYVDFPLYTYKSQREGSITSGYQSKDIHETMENILKSYVACREHDNFSKSKDLLTEMIRKFLIGRLLLLQQVETIAEGLDLIDLVYDFLDENFPTWNKSKLYKSRFDELEGAPLMRLTREGAIEQFSLSREAVRCKNNNLKEHPRPNFVRDSFINLNGLWDYAFAKTAEPRQMFDGKIQVPYSPEAALSGVERQLQPDEYLHYHMEFLLTKQRMEAYRNGKRRLWIHFGAVDQRCKLYINGQPAGEHRGGYLPFSFDISTFVDGQILDLYLVVQDISDTGYETVGKQKLKVGGIFYTAQSGIWQTVWMEETPANYIEKVDLKPDLKKGAVDISVESGSFDDAPCCVTILHKGKTIAKESVKLNRQCTIKIPEPELWSPESPSLYRVIVEAAEDNVESYFAMRTVEVKQNSRGIPTIHLNGKPYFVNGILDQGYWKDGLYTAPDDKALAQDIRNIKKLGFNCLRKHVKIEPLNWYYHCDKEGILVIQDMVNGGEGFNKMRLMFLPNILPGAAQKLRDDAYGKNGRGTEESRELYVSETESTISLLKGFPSIIMWVPFNEGWGQFDSEKITNRILMLDQSRLVDSASGWFDRGCGHVKSIHNYFLPFSFKTERERAVMLTEYGGKSLRMDDVATASKGFGYGSVKSIEDLTAIYEKSFNKNILANIEKGLCGCIYTQLSDVEEEINGLYTFDRSTLKMDAETLKALNKKINDINQFPND